MDEQCGLQLRTTVDTQYLHHSGYSLESLLIHKYLQQL
jgi:hypothetical protein